MRQNIANFLCSVINSCTNKFAMLEHVQHMHIYLFIHESHSVTVLATPPSASLSPSPCLFLFVFLSLLLAAWGDFLTVVCDRTYENVLQYPFYVITSVRPCRQLCQNVWQRFTPSLCHSACVCVFWFLFLLLLYSFCCFYALCVCV